MAPKGTQTQRNVLTAFAGESQARNRYTCFASAARKEGFRRICEIFQETANQGKEHAKRLFKLLDGAEVEFAAAFPAGTTSGSWPRTGRAKFAVKGEGNALGRGGR